MQPVIVAPGLSSVELVSPNGGLSLNSGSADVGILTLQPAISTAAATERTMARQAAMLFLTMVQPPDHPESRRSPMARSLKGAAS